jgi:hypothetical protein
MESGHLAQASLRQGKLSGWLERGVAAAVRLWRYRQRAAMQPRQAGPHAAGALATPSPSRKELLRGRGGARGQHNLTHLPNLHCTRFGWPTVTSEAIGYDHLPFKPVFEAKKRRSPQNSAAAAALPRGPRGPRLRDRGARAAAAVLRARARVVPLLDARPQPLK